MASFIGEWKSVRKVAVGGCSTVRICAAIVANCGVSSTFIVGCAFDGDAEGPAGVGSRPGTVPSGAMRVEQEVRAAGDRGASAVRVG